MKSSVDGIHEAIYQVHEHLPWQTACTGVRSKCAAADQTSLGLSYLGSLPCRHALDMAKPRGYWVDGWMVGRLVGSQIEVADPIRSDLLLATYHQDAALVDPQAECKIKVACMLGYCNYLCDWPALSQKSYFIEAMPFQLS